MASPNATVTITHNGLREKISFDKSYPLMHALEVYCAKYGLDPAKYALHSGRTKVDLAMPFQFSSVSNNALLELETKSGGVDTSATEVRVALEKPGGGRLEGSFFTKATLADIILSFVRSGDLVGYDDNALLASNFEGVTAVYVRRPVKGSDLLTTTLSSLGAVKGAASLRLTLPPPTSILTTASATPITDTAAASPRKQVSDDAGTMSSASEVVSPDAPSASGAGMLSSPETDTTSISTIAHAPLPHIPSNTPTVSDVHADSTTNPDSVVTAPAVDSAAADTVHSSTPKSAAGESAPKRPRLLQTHDEKPTNAATGGAAGEGTSLAEVAQRARKAIARLRAVNFDADSKDALLTIIKILDNLKKNFGDVKVRTLRFANAKFTEAVGRHPAAVEVLCAAGFEDIRAPVTGERILQMGEKEDETANEVIRDVLEAELRSMGVDVPPAPVVDTAARRNAAAAVEAAVEEFDPFKTNVLRMAPHPEVSASERTPVAPPTVPSTDSSIQEASESDYMTAAEKRVADLRRRAAELQAAHRPRDRATRVVLFDPASSLRAGVTSGTDSVLSGAGVNVGDDVDESDPEVQRMLSEYAKKKMAEFNAEKSVKSQAHRELEVLQAAKVFTTTSIKVELPDRTVLQGVFSPLDSIADVYDWVKSLLTEEAAASPFYLFSTPPTVAHPPSPTTLGELKMFPAKVLRLGWGSGLGSRLPPEAAPSDPKAYLKEDVHAAAVAGAAISVSIASSAVDLIAKPSSAVSDADLDEMTAMLMRGENPFAGTKASETRKPAGKDSKGKPSWLKL